MKKIIVFCLLASIIFSCGSKKAVARKRASSKPKTEKVVVVKDSKVDETNQGDTEEVVNGVEVKINSTDEYIALFKTIAQDEMRLYHIPASITIAQGILESNSGRGRLSVEANNHFGIKCHEWTGAKVYHDDDAAQECFRKYIDAKYSYRDHSLFLTERKRYQGLFKLKKGDYKAWAKGLKAAGYATDKKYPDKLISLIERYDLAKFDEEVLGSAYEKGDDIIIDRELPSKTLNQFNNENQIHIVEKGNTLYYISQKYNTTVEELQRLNNLKGTEVSIGQKIKVSAQQEVAQKSINHKVEQGETLYSISRKYNTTVQSLQQLNGLSDNTISIGQTLLISKN